MHPNYGTLATESARTGGAISIRQRLYERLKLLPAIALISLALSGCALTTLSTELRALDQSAVLTGNLSYGDREWSTAYVLAIPAEGDENPAADAQAITRAGPFGLVVRAGRYHLLAFEDTDGNGAFDEGEPNGCLFDAEASGLPAASGNANFNITLDATARCFASFSPVQRTVPERPAARRPELAEIKPLDAPIFDPGNGQLALWEPYSFVETIRGGLYFAAPYDPEKTPVLFVHGAGGTPRDWNYFIKRLDKTRYQPWYYYYASGMSLNDTAFWLNKIVIKLKARYGFNQLVVVAHSMGGLVARRFIAYNTDSGGNYITQFISISTPWGGIETAALGVNFLPVSMPSWSDLAPGSEFLTRMYRQSLPKTLRFYLFAGALPDKSGHPTTSDGTVSVASQLEPHITATATDTVRFLAGHTEIINNPDVFMELDRVLMTKAGQ